MRLYQDAQSIAAAAGMAAVLGGKLIGANMNSTADQLITIASPTLIYQIQNIQVKNPSISLTTAVGGIYPAAAKAGTQIVANTQVYSSLTGAAVGANNSLLQLTLGGSNSTVYDLTAIYLSLTTPQGAAATADFYVFIRPFW